MHASPVHIAGIGISRTQTTDASAVGKSTLAATIKALLDAGITYSSVDQIVACFLDDRLRVSRACFDSLGTPKASICEVDNRSAFFTAVQYIASGQRKCGLLVGFDKTQSISIVQSERLAAVAIVIVSDRFLASHAYLRDSSIVIRTCTLTNHESLHRTVASDVPKIVDAVLQSMPKQARLEREDIQIVEVQQIPELRTRQGLAERNDMLPQDSVPFVGTTGLAGLCGLVWQLRGWAHDPSLRQLSIRNCLQYTLGPDGLAGVIILSRSDDQVVPSWNDVENLRDGRERLGYNPALQMRGLNYEDLEAVKEREGDRVDGTRNLLQLPVRGGDRVALARL